MSDYFVYFLCEHQEIDLPSFCSAYSQFLKTLHLILQGHEEHQPIPPSPFARLLINVFLEWHELHYAKLGAAFKQYPELLSAWLTTFPHHGGGGMSHSTTPAALRAFGSAVRLMQPQSKDTTDTSTPTNTMICMINTQRKKLPTFMGTPPSMLSVALCLLCCAVGYALVFSGSIEDGYAPTITTLFATCPSLVALVYHSWVRKTVTKRLHSTLKISTIQRDILDMISSFEKEMTDTVGGGEEVSPRRRVTFAEPSASEGQQQQQDIELQAVSPTPERTTRSSTTDFFELTLSIGGQRCSVSQVLSAFHSGIVIILCHRKDLTIDHWSLGAQQATDFCANDVMGLSILSLISGTTMRNVVLQMIADAEKRFVASKATGGGEAAAAVILKAVSMFSQSAGTVSMELTCTACVSGEDIVGYFFCGRVSTKPTIIQHLIQNWQHQVIERMALHLQTAWKTYLTNPALPLEHRQSFSAQMVGQYLLHTQHIISCSSPAHVEHIIAKAQTFEPANVRLLVGNVISQHRAPTPASNVRQVFEDDVPTYVRLDEERMFEVLSFLLVFATSAINNNSSNHENGDKSQQQPHPTDITVHVSKTPMSAANTCLYALEFVVESQQLVLSSQILDELQRPQQQQQQQTPSQQNSKTSTDDLSAQMRKVHLDLLSVGGWLVCHSGEGMLGSKYVVTIPMIPADIFLEDDDTAANNNNKKSPLHQPSTSSFITRSGDAASESIHLSVLLYDERAVYLMALSRLLLSAHHSLSTTSNPHEVFDILTRCPDFQVCIYDVSSSKTAIELLLAKIVQRQSAYSAIQFVVTAPMFSEAERLRYEKTYNCLTLTKPCTADDLHQVLCILQRRELAQRQKRSLVLKVRKLFSEHKTCAWERLECIGRGAFGSVYKAKNLTTGGVMAVKVVPVFTGERASLNDDIINEIELLSTLHNDRIIHYLYSEKLEHEINIFMEYANGGSLLAKLEEEGLVGSGSGMSEVRLAACLRDVLDGLIYLHDTARVIHRDIKAANILLSDGRCKLGDFQTAVRLAEGSDGYVEGLKGTSRWMAPEVARQSKYDWRVDIWSFGCLALELLTGEVPFRHIPGNALQFTAYLSGLEEDPMLTPGEWPFSAESREFIEACLRVNPTQRPSAKDLKNNFAFLNDTDLEMRKLNALGRRNPMMVMKRSKSKNGNGGGLGGSKGNLYYDPNAKEGAVMEASASGLLVLGCDVALVGGGGGGREKNEKIVVLSDGDKNTDMNSTATVSETKTDGVEEKTF